MRVDDLMHLLSMDPLHCTITLSRALPSDKHSKMDVFEEKAVSNPADDVLNEFQHILGALSDKSNVLVQQQAHQGTRIAIGQSRYSGVELKSFQTVSAENVHAVNVVNTLASVFEECDRLSWTAKHHFFTPLTTFGRTTDNSDEDIAQLLEEFSKHFSLFQSLCQYSNRCKQVLQNLLLQIQAISIHKLNLEYCILSISNLLCGLYTIESIVKSNDQLQKAWGTYKRMLQYSKSNIEDFVGSKAAQFSQMEVFAQEVDTLFGEPGFLLCTLGDLSSFSVLVDPFEKAVVGLLSSLSKSPLNSFSAQKLAGLICSLVLLSKMSPGYPKSRTYKLFWALQSQYGILTLFAEASLDIAEFLTHYLPPPLVKLSPDPSSTFSTAVALTKKLDLSFAKDMQKLAARATHWALGIESSSKINVSDVEAYIEDSIAALKEGVSISSQIHNLLSTFLFLHSSTGVAMQHGNVRSISIALELLDMIHSGVYKRQLLVPEFHLEYASFLLCKLSKEIQGILDETSTSSENRKFLQIALESCKAPPSLTSLLVIKSALSLLHNVTIIDCSDDILTLLRFPDVIMSSSIPRFMFFFLDIVPSILEDMLLNPIQALRLPHLFRTLSLACKALGSSSFESSLNAIFDTSLIRPLCSEIETDLRLHTHSLVLQHDLQLDDSKDYSVFLETPMIELGHVNVSVKQRVCHYLDKTFYNLSTVASHDWKIYAEMRTLASQKYNLILKDVHLPSSSHYTSGLDVLEIARKIHVFVSQFTYNLNSQTFVQRSINQKHLSTITIPHISNSIRTHGAGIVNTTINFTYKFLAKKFHIVSEFLYDDHIFSRLVKDIKYFNDAKDQIDHFYPYQRANRFNQEIRILGVSEDGKSYLDHFRQVITEIGNALGYVRMIRCGNLNASSNAMKFVPEVESLFGLNFSNLVDGLSNLQISQETKDAAENLDVLLDILKDQFEEGTNYFQILVKVISNVLSKGETDHLKNFYVIIPPLSINFIEKMLQQKERLGNTSACGESAFSDDGFALGLAYILKVLNQGDEFDSLHWFESAKQDLQSKEASLSSERKVGFWGKNDADAAENVKVSLHRCNLMRKELDLLYFALSDARIFFKTDQDHLDE